MAIFRIKPFIRGEINISADGIVLKFNHNTGEWQKTRGRADPSGHYYVDYKGKKYYVHKMVAAAFIPVPDYLRDRDDVDVHHLDEDKTRNVVENLEYIGHREHSSLHKAGELNSNAKLSDDEAKEIREYKGKRNVHAVAKQYGVSTQTIHRIWSGAGWQIE